MQFHVRRGIIDEVKVVGAKARASKGNQAHQPSAFSPSNDPSTHLPKKNAKFDFRNGVKIGPMGRISNFRRRLLPRLPTLDLNRRACRDKTYQFFFIFSVQMTGFKPSNCRDNLLQPHHLLAASAASWHGSHDQLPAQIRWNKALPSGVSFQTDVPWYDELKIETKATI
jgi:hypothetical protein